MPRRPCKTSSQVSRDLANLKIMAAVAILYLPLWTRWLRPTLSDYVDTMIATRALPIEFADALDDIGQFCQRLAQEIITARMRAGLPFPPGPDD